MRTRNILSAIAAFVITLAASFSSSAQDWNSVKRFMTTTNACRTLATLAHPTSDYISSSVTSSTSSTITVSIKFQDGWTDDYYTSKYELEKASIGGGNFISRVRCTSEGDWVSSFTAWSSISDYTLYSLAFDNCYRENPSEIRSIYGGSRFSDISNSAKAAFVMTMLYADYIG